MPNKIFLTFKSVGGGGGGRGLKPSCETIQMKAIEQYFHVVLSTELYKMVLLTIERRLHHWYVTLSLWMNP